MRFYPFSFKNEPAFECVLEIELIGASVTVEQIAALIGQEVEVTVLDSTVLIDSTLNPQEVSINAKEIRTARVPYDLRDFSERVSGLENAWQHEHEELRLAKAKLSTLSKLVDELKRRAAIKSNASEDKRNAQAAALRVLDRLEAELYRKHD
ncbi:MAG: hypothetical protein AAFP81_19275 [Pseudomonadota bacterium]